MKKNIISLVWMVILAAGATAQDTIRYADPWYSFNPPPDNDLELYEQHIEFNESEMGRLLTRLLPVNVRVSINDSLPVIQPYPVTDGTIYGIAVTPRFIAGDMEIFDAIMMCFSGVSIVPTPEGPYHTNYVDITATRIDSVNTLDAALTKDCWFEYELYPGSEYTEVVQCIEYYFESPIQVGRSKDMMDTLTDAICIGGFSHNHFAAYRTGIDLTYSQLRYAYSDSPEYHSASLPQYYNSTGGWGGLFPIVKLRCTVPRGLRIAGGADVTALWRSNTDADLFQLSVCTGDMTADSGILLTTTDTSMALPALAADSSYHIYLRKQCAYCATTWADTVWSDWSAPVTIEATTGIGGMRQVSFTLSPNPARDAVRLVCDEPVLGIEVMDMAGRIVSSESGAMGPEFTIDVRRLPAGVYTVRVTTATGTALRRLTVE